MLLITLNVTGQSPVQSSFSFVVKQVSVLVIVKLWESTWTAGKTGNLHFLHSSVASCCKPLTSPNASLFCHLKTAEDINSLFKELLIHATARDCRRTNKDVAIVVTEVINVSHSPN